MKQTYFKITKDEIRRIIYLKNELLIKLLKSIYKNQQVSKNIRFWVFIKLQRRCIFLSRQNNRCIVTGRSGGVYKFGNISRHMLNKRLQLGIIPNIRSNNIK